jgi:hypothetical protein
LITADFALEEGREVFAVPGEITSDTPGRHALGPLRRGVMTPSLSSELFSQDSVNSLRIVRRDRGVDPSPGVEHESEFLPGSAAVEVPPMYEVSRAPDPPLSDTERREVLYGPD